MLNATFKTNPYLERGILTGITRVSKESIFSDLNNLRVVTTTCNEYAASFGFTEREVFTALEQFGLAYSSSNGLIDSLIRTGNSYIKKKMEALLQKHTIIVELDEQIIFNQLPKKKNAIWSFLLASGYLKVVHTSFGEASGKRDYELALTNKEVALMFQEMISEWFDNGEEDSNSESGFGRYDVMICPLKSDLPAFVLEFKVYNSSKEKSLEDTVLAAHRQMEEMKYDTRLLERGIRKEQIRHYGFAFEGKTVLIG